MGPAPLGENWRRGEIPTSGGAPSQMGDQVRQKRNFGGSEETAGTGLWQAGQSERYTEGPSHNTACPSLRRVSTGRDRGWVLEHGVWRADMWKGLLWLWGDSLRGQQRTALQLGMLEEETQTAIEVKCNCWVMCKGWSCLGSLSPHTLVPASMGTRKGS